MVPSVLFNLVEDKVSVTIGNTWDEKCTVHENTTLGTSEFSPKQALNHIVSAPPKSKPNEVDESYELKHVIDSISPAIPIKMRQKVAELEQEFAVVFSKNQGDISRRVATSNKIDVYPVSKPVKLPNRNCLYTKSKIQQKKSTLF